MVLMSGLGFFMTGTDGRTDNRVRRSPYSHKGNIGESDVITMSYHIALPILSRGDI